MPKERKDALVALVVRSATDSFASKPPHSLYGSCPLLFAPMSKQKKKEKPFKCPYCMLPCSSTGGVTKHVNARHRRMPIRTYTHNAARRSQHATGSSADVDDVDRNDEDTSMSDEFIIDDAQERGGEGDLDEVSHFLK